LEKDNKSYSTQQIWIKQGHPLYTYFQSMGENSKNMFNTTNFYIRQIYTALKSEKELHSLQKEVLELLQQNINGMNNVQLKSYEKKVKMEGEKPLENRKEIKLTLFSLPDSSNPYVTYNFLDSLFKRTKQND
jgi:putative transposase